MRPSKANTRSLACLLSARPQRNKEHQVIQQDPQNLDREGKFEANRDAEEPQNKVTLDDAAGVGKSKACGREDNAS